MQTILDLKSDTSNPSPTDVLLGGERENGTDWLRVTLSNPHREIVMCRSELMKTLGVLWRQE
jgi:hypothetical protein